MIRTKQPSYTTVHLVALVCYTFVAPVVTASGEGHLNRLEGENENSTCHSLDSMRQSVDMGRLDVEAATLMLY